jgi:hypothetical protein
MPNYYVEVLLDPVTDHYDIAQKVLESYKPKLLARGITTYYIGITSESPLRGSTDSLPRRDSELSLIELKKELTHYWVLKVCLDPRLEVLPA